MEQIGRYQNLREIGRGAMGVVYAASDPLIGRTVAIKTIHLGVKEYGLNREELRNRLFREAQSAGILSHPGIITIHDIGEQDEEAYIVMEFVDGETLEDVFSSGAPQHSERLFSILKQAAEALDYAHGKGIVHRDIKPSNIMLCANGTLKIADFGIAKISASAQLTQTGFAVGTPNYMSPEQAQGHPVEGRSDQFSLAIVAYRMLTGKLPFDGPIVTAVLAKLLMADPDYESAGLQPKIQAVFRRALSKDPQGRYADCTEFILALQSAYASCKENLLAATMMTPMPAVAKSATAVTAQEEIPAGAGAEPPSAVSPQAAPSAVSATQGAGFDNELQITELKEGGGIAGASWRAGQVVPPIPAQQRAGAAAQEPGATASPGDSPPERRTAGVPRLAWLSALAVLILAIAGFFMIRGLRKPEPSAALSPAEAALKLSPDQAPPAAPKEADGSDKKAAAAASETGEDAGASMGIDPKAGASEPSAANSPSLPVEKTKSAERAIPNRGVLTWSGQLGKNSILVIDGARGPSTGTVTGKFPGKPIRITVQPEGVEIRQKPGRDNGWSRIVLSSGSQRRTSISIRWEILQ